MKNLLKSQLMSYQKDAFKKLKDNERGCLFFEPGLGKTITAIAIAKYWLNESVCDTVFVFTKKHLVKTWEEEFLIHTNEKPILPIGKNNSFSYSFFPKNTVHILHYQSGFSILFLLKQILKEYKVGIILDECQVIKNCDTKITKIIFEIAENANRKLIMSGTPVANRPYDLISQLAFLEKNKYFKNITKRQLDLPQNNLKCNFTNLEKRIAFLKSEIDKISYTYTKEKLLSSGNIVKKTEKTILFKLNKRQKYEYNSILPSNLELARHKGSKRNAWIIQSISRLVQVCSETKKTSFDEKSEKEKYLLEQAAACKEKGESFIVWTSFVSTCDRLACILKKFNVYKVHGRINQNARNRAIADFKRTKSSILIATMQSCKEGLNFQNAVKCYFYDPALRLDDILQAQDRIHRVNQKKPVFVYYLIYKQTIECWIHKLHELKKHFSIDIFNNSQKLNENYIFDSSNLLRDYLK